MSSSFLWPFAGLDLVLQSPEMDTVF